jgi:hypothetical protein
MRRSFIISISILSFIFLLMVACGGGGGNVSDSSSGETGIANTTSSSTDLTGLWKAYFTAEGETNEGNFVITQSGNDLVIISCEDYSQDTGTINGTQVEVTVIAGDGTVTTFTGTVDSSGTSMNGTWRSNDGREGTWNAQKLSDEPSC